MTDMEVGREDRDVRCGLLCRDDRCAANGDNDIDLELDQLGGDLGIALAASFRPAILSISSCTLAALTLVLVKQAVRSLKGRCSRRGDVAFGSGGTASISGGFLDVASGATTCALRLGTPSLNSPA